jgi:hypothetical protein
MESVPARHGRWRYHLAELETEVAVATSELRGGEIISFHLRPIALGFYEVTIFGVSCLRSALFVKEHLSKEPPLRNVSYLAHDRIVFSIGTIYLISTFYHITITFT